MGEKPLVIPLVLTGENYLLWARTAKTNLGSKGLWRHVKPKKAEEAKMAEEAKKKAVEARMDSDDSDDEDLTPEEEKWKQNDQVVLAAIHASLEHSILQAYSYCKTAKELWETLKGVYGDVSNLTRVYEVKKALNNLHQRGEEFKAHFGKYRSLLAELDMLRPSSMDPKTIRERKEQDSVFGLLMSLDPCYNELVRHILRGETLPTLEGVCSQIQKEKGSSTLFDKEALPTAHKAEISKEATPKEETPTANKADFRRNGERRTIICDHCKKPGHKKAQCYFLHPHLRPNRDAPRGSNQGGHGYGNPRSNYANGEPSQGPGNQGEMMMKKSDVEALIQAMANKLSSGISFSSQFQNNELVVDSGATHHMISNDRLLSNIKPIHGNVIIANGDKIPIKGIGNLDLFDKTSNAFYMPSFNSNLLSVKKATNDLNFLAIFGPNHVQFQDIESGKVLGKGGTREDLYVLEDFTSKFNSDFNSKLALTASNNHVVDELWHARLGHPHSRAFELLFPSIKFDNSRCEACILGKHCKFVFPKSSTIYEKSFDLIHTDVWTSPCVSRDNHKYFVTFIDEKSKYTWITLLPSKDRVFDAFQNFQNYVTNQFDAKIKVLRSDNGGEYTSTAFKEYLATHGIIHQTTCPYTPQQNGVAERKNRHLMEVARSMMFHNNVPKRFWGDAVMASCYLINRIPTRILNDLSPFEVLNKTKPFLNHLRVFGCVCFALVPGGPSTKLDAKSIRCIFLGYSITQKGYKCFDPSNNRTYVTREVKFFEEQGYYKNRDWDSLKDLANSPSDRAASLRFILESLGSSDVSGNLPQTEGTTPTGSGENHPRSPEVTPHVLTPAEPDTSSRTSTANNRISTANDREIGPDSVIPEGRVLFPDGENDGETAGGEEEVFGSEGEPVAVVPEQPVSLPRRSERVRKPPEEWVNSRVYYRANAVVHPAQGVCVLDDLPEEHKAFIGKMDANAIPQSYEEAKGHEVWDNAVADEVGAMVRNKTWDEEVLPPEKRCVSSRWVFTIKYKSDGTIERYKARLVARGFSQKYGDDFTETFAPVAKQHTVKVILSLATNLDWGLWQMDVKNAFLQGDLEEEVYMSPPPGLENQVAPGKVLRLRKAIYGLKQSPRAWYQKLSSTLLDNDFRKCPSDTTLFTKQDKDGIVVVLVYVDDLIISSNNKEGIQSIKSALHTTFDIKDLGELKYFLGIEVCRSPEGLFLSQRKYALDLLELTGTLGCKPAKTPLEAGYKVAREGEQDDTPYKDVAQYRRMVGKLIYLTYTRPDLCFAVNQVSQHMQHPTVYHWSLIERILRYIKGSPGKGIWMGKNKHTEIIGYCDADWAGDRNDRKSTTGYCTFVGGNLVTWKTKKQKVVSCSSAEAEYRAMRKLTEELVWLKALLTDLGFETKEPITMHGDNQAAIHIATNPVFHERTKHIEIDCHKVREKVEEGVIIPSYTRSGDNLADIFTKAASLQVCEHIHHKLGLVDLTRSC